MTPPVRPAKNGKCSSSFLTFSEILFDFPRVNKSTDMKQTNGCPEHVSIVDRSA